MNSSNQNADGLRLIVSCQVEHDKLEALSMLLQELIPIASIPNIEHLQGIFVVPDAEKENIVNELIHELGKSERSYVAGTKSTACAVPIEINENLFCFIVLEESLVQQIDPKNFHSPDLVLTLLEELLHVRLYNIVWQHRGYLYPQHNGSGCREHLLDICWLFHDEYVVNRWKFSKFASDLRIENENGLTSVFRYNFPLAKTLDMSSTKLFSIIHDAIAKNLSIHDAWISLIHCLYRDIFELLARDAGTRAGVPSELAVFQLGASESRFYQKRIAPYWEKILVQLERSFNSEFLEKDAAMDEMVEIIKTFLMSIGVTYYKTVSGDYQINFVSL